MTKLSPMGQRKTIVHVDDTVRRPWQPWSPAVKALLEHLESAGFDGAPRWLGEDNEGREVLSFIEGVCPDYPLLDKYWSDTALPVVARLLRSFHDATVPLATSDLPWRFSYAGSHATEVICHNDVAPYNTIYREGVPVAFIDFDTVGPGPRIRDVCYAAYRFVPLMPREDFGGHGVPDNLEIPKRLASFCSAYGDFDGDLIDELVVRLRMLAEHIHTEAARGVPWHVDNVASGHPELYQRHAAWVSAARERLIEIA